MSVTNPDKQPRKQARSEERQTTFLSTKMVTEKNSRRNPVHDRNKKCVHEKSTYCRKFGFIESLVTSLNSVFFEVPRH